VYRVITVQQSKTERKAYNKALSTLYHVGETCSAALKSNTDESNTSAGGGASTAFVLRLVDSRFDSSTGEQ
jgi:hypothetical protein